MDIEKKVKILTIIIIINSIITAIYYFIPAILLVEALFR